MRYFIASGDVNSTTWGLLPPVLPTGQPFAAAELITSQAYADTKLLFPVGRQGSQTDFSFIYWQTYALSSDGRAVLEQRSPRGVWYSPAETTEGSKVWVLRAPLVTDAIECEKSNLTRHPQYPERHPFFAKSGHIRLAYTLCLNNSVIDGYDFFFLTEYPIVMIVSERIVEYIASTGLSGFGTATFPAITTCNT